MSSIITVEVPAVLLVILIFHVLLLIHSFQTGNMYTLFMTD